MTLDRKKRIERSFGANAHSYHHHAYLQRQIAKTLAALLPNNTPAKILEIGCGTGFLTEELLQKYPKSNIHATDISTDMLRYTQQRFIGYKNLTFSKQDGENLNLDDDYDLIVSSMAVQWFDTPYITLQGYKKHLTPRGSLYFSTLGADSFKEWRACLNKLSMSNGLLDTHSYDGMIIREDREILIYNNSMDFLKSFKIIGAQQSNKNHTPLSPSNLKQACNLLEQDYGAAVTWHIQYGHITNNA